MTKSMDTGVSPIGTPVAEDVAQRAARSAVFRAEQERLAEYAAIAAQIILHRTRTGLTQEDLARRVGTSPAAISRIESGQHKTSVETLRRVAHALNLRLTIKFERLPVQLPDRELVGTRAG
jgi:ribosome-binding protein aMBF1 (putative translation factor)